jgi:serine/threonine-protein phosphatase 4 regulatory subunit 4
VIELYSKNFFKEYFYEYVLELQTDSVPNVRLRLCSILPQLKKIIKLPTDRNLLQQLESCVRKILLSEKDRDVLIAIKQVNIIIVVILYILSRAVMVVIVLYLN